MTTLAGKTVLISGASRGIGLAIALRAAAVAKSRRPEIMSDAAHAILTRDSRTCTGNFFLDEDVLRAEGVTDFSGYRFTEGDDADLDWDFFLEEAPLPHRFG